MNESTNNALQVGAFGFGIEKEVYCSMPVKSVEDRKLVAKALEQSDVLLNDCVGQEILVKGIYSEQKQVEKLDEDGNPIINKVTGEVEMMPKYRTILFGDDGKTYATGAYGIYASLKSMFFVYGTPDQWDAPIKVKVIKQKISDKKTSLKLEY